MDQQSSEQPAKPFKLEFSNRVIEHLGIKLYQNKPTNVVAEFLSNSWDADATKVHIEMTAHGANGHPTIVITDNGRGMTRKELTDEFLVIGRNRRTSPTDRTQNSRPLMGRKGIGKLAGFGIAETLEILSSPNLNTRLDATSTERKFYWLRFSLKELLTTAGSAFASSYEPEVVADGADETHFKKLIDNSEQKDYYQHFMENAKSGAGGVCVVLTNTTLKKAMNVDSLLQSMGRRFTVAMLKPDFVVTVNGKPITPELALPPLHEFGFGDWNNPIEADLMFADTPRKIRYWIKFVNLENSDWSIENAGIGVYAHGKIAQDRPFFFDVKGKEIWSRYVYGVIEADWLDELPRDVVSTDRRSIDWDTSDTVALHNWGNGRMSYWLDEFRKWMATRPKKNIVKRIREVSPGSTLTGQEEEALAELLSEVLPGLANDEASKNRVTKSFTEAWTHGPTRMLTKSLWDKLFSSFNLETSVFANLLETLRKSMIPEAMGLAVTVAQRVAAITAMRRMIEESKTETHLQRLIENFPWLLGPMWERLTANQTIRTLIVDKHKPDQAKGEWSIAGAKINLKPDFVFLSDPGGHEEFIVFELKGPEAGKTLQPVEYRQLIQYLDIISDVYTDQKITVKGVLVGHDKGGFKETDNRIDVKTWAKVLLDARNLHVEYLRALLLASDPSATDARLRQIADFGGSETIELLTKLAPIGDFPNVITDMLKLFKESGNATLPEMPIIP